MDANELAVCPRYGKDRTFRIERSVCFASMFLMDDPSVSNEYAVYMQTICCECPERLDLVLTIPFMEDDQ